MAECAFCKTETQIYENGTPICIRCSEARDRPAVSSPATVAPRQAESRIREILRREVLETTAIVSTASEEFNALRSAIPSGVPHPDGSLRLHQVSDRLSAARKNMIRAHSRMNDYLSRGIVPEELKRAAGESN